MEAILTAYFVISLVKNGSVEALLALYHYGDIIICDYILTNHSSSKFAFQLLTKAPAIRSGIISTKSGSIRTPVFMPVGTQSCIKALSWDQVEALGAEIVLANTYHLHLRPGEDLIAEAGGLQQWTNFQKPFLTDSGGFQIFSQARLNRCKITDRGAEFIDHIDGSKHFIGPRESIQIQHKLGADIIMAFDHCPPGQVTYAEARDAMERTHLWAEICVDEHEKLSVKASQEGRSSPALFLIVQGSTYKELRTESAKTITSMRADGYAIGGVSVGETREEIDEIVKFTAPLLAEDKPRYLMGVGTHEDVIKAIQAGIDMFDCVMPTRIARHGCFFDIGGKRQLIKAERYRSDFAPLMADCECYSCKRHSRAYIRHLWRVSETLAGTLLSIHNLHYLINLAKSQTLE